MLDHYIFRPSVLLRFLLIVMIPGTTFAAKSLVEIESNFAEPPAVARPYLWWHWMNGNISRAGITKDLEAMAKIGVGGVIVFEESNKIPPGPIKYASKEHFDMFAYASAECDRLGLDFGFHNGPGWSSSGGPWIDEDHAMKHYTWSETKLEGGAPQNIALARPSTHVIPYPDLPPPGRYQKHDYYRDVAVIAFPTPKHPDWRVDKWEEKTGLLAGYELTPQVGLAPAGACIAADSIRDLTDQMDENGQLAVSLPEGEWTIIRFGYTLTGHRNRQAPDQGGWGLDCDKMSREAVDKHWNSYVGKVIEASRRYGSDALSTIKIDSYETLTQSWTERMPEEFSARRGYGLLTWLPALTGRVVDSLDRTERFLWDYRETISDLVEDNYYGYFAERCHEAGLKLAVEGYGYEGIFDDYAVARRADIPMGEFWAGLVKYHHWSTKVAASAADTMGRHVVGVEAYTSGGERAAWTQSPASMKTQGDYFLCRGATRFFIQASAHQPWADHVVPGMTMGQNGIQLNRNNTWWEQSAPWMAHLARSQFLLQHGQLVADIFYYYGDNSPSSFRTKYNPRHRWGMPWDPDFDVHPDVWFKLPLGHDFHVGDDRVLLDMTVNEAGQIVLPGGLHYEILVLPKDTRMRLPILQKIASLVEQGATVVGPRPTHTPGLDDDLANDPVVAELANRLWGPLEDENTQPRQVGKGWVFTEALLASVMRAKSIPADFKFEGISPDSKTAMVDYMHRHVDGADVYFVSNQSTGAAVGTAVFRVVGKMPEIWDPQTGHIESVGQWRVREDGRTEVRLELARTESTFVVFREPAAAATNGAWLTGKPAATDDAAGLMRLRAHAGGLWLESAVPGRYEISLADGSQRTMVVSSGAGRTLDLMADWELEFPADRGAPVSYHLPRIASWTEVADDGVKYFSGTATYRKTVDLAASEVAADQLVELDLGEVGAIAEVSVNGVSCGSLWKPPYRLEISHALKVGENEMVVRVTNQWRNQLIGDARIRGVTPEQSEQRMRANEYEVPEWVRRGDIDPDRRVHSFTPFPYYNGEQELLPSGILGPASLRWSERLKVR